MSDLLVRGLGWRALLLQGDPVVLERWKWLRARFRLVAGVGGHAPRTLDAGCGNGAFALWAAVAGSEVVGLSDAPADLRKAQSRAAMLRLQRARFEEFDLRRLADDGERIGEFDAVLCLEVVEHVLDDVGLVRNLAARLRPGGLLFLSTPSDDHRPLFGEQAHLSGVEDGRHVRWGYSERQLTDVLRAAGLEPVEFARFGGYLTQRTCGALWRLQRVSTVAGWALTLPLRAVTLFDHRLTTRLGHPFMSVGAVARKPAQAPGIVR